MTRIHSMNRTPRALTIVDLLVAMVGVCLLLGLTVPMLQTFSCDGMKAQSMSNLIRLAQAHASYAADWDDRQFTLVRDDLGASNGRCDDYYEDVGCHPPVLLGEDCGGVTRGFLLGCDESGPDCDDFWVVSPINWYSVHEHEGSFRLPNVRGFNAYVNGRFYDPVFYAPRDQAVLDVVGPLFDEACEYVDADEGWIFSSSYVLSPAAMYDPEVFNPDDPADPDLDGWENPKNLDDGFRSPTVSQALYPSQKTRMLEHHWLQHAREKCNPGFDHVAPYDGCQPYFFNHSWGSIPVTLFFDGHVRGLSTLEAVIADGRVRAQSPWGGGLWSRDTPWGRDGYRSEYGYDQCSTSYHILTTGGIRGRDTTK